MTGLYGADQLILPVQPQTAASGSAGLPPINLIVDPRMFRAVQHRPLEPRQRRRRERAAKDGRLPRDVGGHGKSSFAIDERLDGGAVSSGSDAWSDSDEAYDRKDVLTRHRDLLAEQRRRREERTQLVRFAAFDACSATIWLLLGGWSIGWGHKCPVGGYSGYW